MSTSPAPRHRLYGMQERADHLDFDVRFQGARDTLAKPHRHEYFQIQVSIDGGSTQAIGGAVRPFTRGHVSFVLPYQVHVVPHPPGARYAIVNFDQRFLWPELDVAPLELDRLPLEQVPGLAPFLCQEHTDFHFDEGDFSVILGWLDRLATLNTRRGFGGTGAIRGILLQWLALACERHEPALRELAAARAAHSPRHDAVQRVMQHVRDHLHEDLTLPDAAAVAMLSPTYLAHLLRQQTGRTFTHLVTERRVERAKVMLVASNDRVRDIATRCGFHDEAYFTRRFRQWTGQTPRQFRQHEQARLSAP